MRINETTGVVYVDGANCIGCGLCRDACPFEPKRILISRDSIALKCDLCGDRPEGPACVEFCQVRCIGLSDSADDGKDGR
jgi:carbon-monoxide dehydrogenase iron sulfur subunit